MADGIDDGSGFVYVFRCVGRYKIGRSHTPTAGEALTDALQLRAVLRHHLEVPAAMEKHFQGRFAAGRRFGEWFELSDAEARLREGHTHRHVWLVLSGEDVEYKPVGSLNVADFRLAAGAHLGRGERAEAEWLDELCGRRFGVRLLAGRDGRLIVIGVQRPEHSPGT